MKRLLHVFLLLLWSLGGVKASESFDVKVTVVPGGYKIVCDGNRTLMNGDKEVVKGLLEFKDENSQEYKCAQNDKRGDNTKIFVKFRTCDNCVELDVASISGLLVGNLVATIMIGFSVYLVASKGAGGAATPGSSSEGHYQKLVKRTDTYDKPKRSRKPEVK